MKKKCKLNKNWHQLVTPNCKVKWNAVFSKNNLWRCFKQRKNMINACITYNLHSRLRWWITIQPQSWIWECSYLMASFGGIRLDSATKFTKTDQYCCIFNQPIPVCRQMHFGLAGKKVRVYYRWLCGESSLVPFHDDVDKLRLRVVYALHYFHRTCITDVEIDSDIIYYL